MNTYSNNPIGLSFISWSIKASYQARDRWRNHLAKPNWLSFLPSWFIQ